MLYKNLAKLDLTDNEIEVFIKLKEVGGINVTQLAKEMLTPRPTLYGLLENLDQKGLVHRTIKNKSAFYTAASDDKIDILFRKRIDELEIGRKDAANSLNLIKSNSIDILPPKFEIFEGEMGLKKILDDMLLYYDMQTYAYWPISKMVEVLSPEYFRWHNVNRIRNRLNVKAIWPQNYVVDSQTHPYLGTGENFLRQIRVAPETVEFTMGYWIYGNKVAFVSSNQESFGYIVESGELSKMLLSQFETIWNISSPFDNQNGFTDEFIQKNII